MGVITLISLEACSENPATGQKQFTGLMPASQEASVGATEHEKAIAEYGVYNNAALQNYVKGIGERLVPVTERKDVSYTFTLLDSPEINAFALPGGYVYVTRGLMAWANSEAELAAVMGHEIGHVNARHSAARYSAGVASQVGLSVLSAVTDVPFLNQAAGLGSNLVLSQYSQGQEHEADTLGIRYTQKIGYDPLAMSSFLKQLNRESAYEQQFKGQRAGGGLNQFFASHPTTPSRVAQSQAEGAAFAGGNYQDNVTAYMRAIEGLPYGTSAKDGYVNGQSFVHPSLGFRFDAPTGTALTNGASNVTATRNDGLSMIFDMAQKDSNVSINDYLSVTWMKNAVANVENLTINGMPAVTAMSQGVLNGQTMAVRVVAIQADATHVYRFQYAMPQAKATDVALQNEVQISARSFRRLSDSERNVTVGQKVHIVAAANGDTAASMAARMTGFASAAEAKGLFMAINAIDSDAQPLQAGRLYKIIQ